MSPLVCCIACALGLEEKFPLVYKITSSLFIIIVFLVGVPNEDKYVQRLEPEEPEDSCLSGNLSLASRATGSCSSEERQVEALALNP